MELLEIQRLRFLGDAISGAPLTEDEQARPDEVHEQANVPNLLLNRTMRQGAIRGWEGQEIVIDNGSTTDSGIGTMSPGTSTATETTNVIPASSLRLLIATDSIIWCGQTTLELMLMCMDRSISLIMKKTRRILHLQETMTMTTTNLNVSDAAMEYLFKELKT